jgi:hypothetical protein
MDTCLRNKIREEEEIGQEIVFLFHITSMFSIGTTGLLLTPTHSHDNGLAGPLDTHNNVFRVIEYAFAFETRLWD